MQTIKPYSEALRLRILKSPPRRWDPQACGAAQPFGVSLSSVKRYAGVAQRGASPAPRKGGGRPPKADETTRKLLEEGVKERPAATASERCRFLRSTTGRSLGLPTVERLLRRRGFGQKNGLVGAVERDEFLRAAWKAMVSKKVDPERLVFVDETGANTSLSPLRAWSRRGQRAYRSRSPATVARTPPCSPA
jgi:transposase